MKAATFNGCKVYNLSSGKTMPGWLSQSKKRALLKDEEYRKRLELIQDFEMTTASHCLRMTNDGQHIIATGTYPPLVRCYTTSDMAMKFQRGMTCDIIDMETLSDDYGKLVFLQSDRTLSFHAPYGKHYDIRVPKFGRNLLYNWSNCDLYVAGAGDEVYRLNLEAGQFREPFTLSFSGCNKLHQNPVHQLLACGGEGGICEFWDPRSRKPVARIQVPARSGNSGLSNHQHERSSDITALQFDTDGLTLGVGTNDGTCLFYDIRSRQPLHVKEHQYGLPIINITYHNDSRHIITTDKKIVKIWERDEPNMGKIMTNIETPADMNDLCVVRDQRGQSGLLMMAGEQSRLMTYFVPQLGPAPRWCSFLESLTEELEEASGQSVYDDFKFLTLKEVEDLGAVGLIGTPMVKGYMHGFFMEMKLYSKLRAVSKPFEYEEHRKRKIREKIDAKRQSRITAVKRLPKVNTALAEKLMRKDGRFLQQEEDAKDGVSSNNKANTTTNPTGKGKSDLIDPRFAKLFEREEFQQDEEAEEYKLRNPTRSTKFNGAASNVAGDWSDDDNLDDLYEPVEGMDVGRDYNDSDDNDDDDDDDDYDDDAEENSGSGRGGDDDHDHDDEDLEPIRAMDSDRSDVEDDTSKNGGGGGVARRSSRKQRQQDEDENEEGDILKTSRRMSDKYKQRQLRQTSSLNKPLVGKSIAAGPPPTAKHSPHSSSKLAATAAAATTTISEGKRSTSKMYALAEGITASSAVFGHTEQAREQRRKDKQRAAIPLSERLLHSGSGSGSGSSSSSSFGSNGGVVDLASSSAPATVKYVRTEKEGLVREMSYIPAASSTGKGSNDKKRRR